MSQGKTHATRTISVMDRPCVSQGKTHATRTISVMDSLNHRGWDGRRGIALSTQGTIFDYTE
ncbi:MAG: hypothetical protein DLM70_03280 [Chloroflexi bacterium]|nr:MAG: hypothetical protein DLM70_03280 [Chloroflexota bacterium]